MGSNDQHVDVKADPIHEQARSIREKAESNLAARSEVSKQRSMMRSICLVAACTTAMLVNISNVTSVSIALPTIGRDLNIAQEKLQWLISAYSLSSGCLLLMFGRIADLYGRKKTFIVGFLGMLAFALGCGFAQNEITIDVLRGCQGIGAAAVVPASLGILAHAFPPSRARSIAFATFSAGAPVGAAFGMTLGGVLTQLSHTTWRSNFYLTAGLCGLGTLAGLFSIDADEPSTEVDKRIDWLGSLLITAGLVLIVFVLSDGEIAPQKWRTPYIIVFLILGVLLVSAFVLWQLYLERVQEASSKESAPSAQARPFWTPPPLLKMSIWKRANGRFAVMQTIACVNWCSFMSWWFWVQLFYQNYQQLSPILTMVRMLPMFVTGLLCNIVVAVVIGHVDVLFIVATGSLLTSAANIFFAVIKSNASYWGFGFPAAILSVFGADFVYATGTIFIAKICLPHEQSVAGALFQTMTQLGTAFGLAITTIVFNRVLAVQSRDLGVTVNVAGTNAPLPAQLKAYQAAEWTAFAFGILGMCLAFFLHGVGIVGHPGPAKPGTDEHEKTLTSDDEKVQMD